MHPDAQEYPQHDLEREFIDDVLNKWDISKEIFRFEDVGPADEKPHLRKVRITAIPRAYEIFNQKFKDYYSGQ